jgi:hypothetical protein
MTGTGRHAELLRARFVLACRRLGLARRDGEALDTTLFQRAPRAGEQLSLL